MKADKRRSPETPNAKSHLYVGDVWRLTGIVGGVFVAGTVLVFLIGVPAARPFAIAAAVLGTAFGLYLWFRRR